MFGTVVYKITERKSSFCRFILRKLKYELTPPFSGVKNKPPGSAPLGTVAKPWNYTVT